MPTVAAGGELIVRLGAGLIVMLSGPVTVLAGFPESVAFTMTVAVPAVVGVPLTTQPFVVSPVGQCAQGDHAVIWRRAAAHTPMGALYGDPTVPFGSVELLRVRGICAALITITKVALALAPFASCACAVKLKLPCAVGVPAITPLAGLRVSPGGRPPERMLHV